MRRLGQVYRRELPRLLRELRWLLLIVFALYLAGCVVGYCHGETTAYGQGRLPFRLPRWMFPFTTARLWGSHGWLHFFGPNTLRAVYGFFWGAVSFGLYGLRSAFAGGYQIGWLVANNAGVAKATAGVGIAGTAAGVLLLHGPFELLAIWLAWALGLRAGLVWLRPLPGLRRWQSAKAVLGEFRTAILAIVPLLLIAGLLEAYANPLFRDHYLLGIGASPAMARERRVGRPFIVGEAAVAPDGETFAASSVSGAKVWISRGAGASKEVSTGGTFHLASPAWSPDGRRLVFIKGFKETWRSELNIVDVATRRTRAVPGGPEGRYQQAAWHPRGARIGVSIMRREPLPRATDLWLVDPVVGRWEQVTHLPGYGLAQGGFSWSPDGKQIAVARRRGLTPYSAQLWVMHADGTGLRKLTDGARDSRPAWSPDGKWIAFLAEPPALGTDYQRFTDPLPMAQICLVRSDGSGRRDGLAKADEYSALSWSPDGKQLLYVRGLTAIMGTPKGL